MTDCNIKPMIDRKIITAQCPNVQQYVPHNSRCSIFQMTIRRRARSTQHFFAGTENLCGIVKKCSVSENRDKKGRAALETVRTDNMKMPRHMPGQRFLFTALYMS